MQNFLLGKELKILISINSDTNTGIHLTMYLTHCIENKLSMPEMLHLGLSASVKKSQGKCSKILKTFLVLFTNKMLVIMNENHKMLFRIANRENPDQTASSV